MTNFEQFSNSQIFKPGGMTYGEAVQDWIDRAEVEIEEFRTALEMAVAVLRKEVELHSLGELQSGNLSDEYKRGFIAGISHQKDLVLQVVENTISDIDTVIKKDN